MPILTVRHVTTYRYANPVAFGEHRLMVHPREDGDLALLEARLEISPAPATIRTERDDFGNLVTFVSFAERAAELRKSSRSVRIVAGAGLIRTERDDFGNLVTFVSFAERAAELRFESRLAVEKALDGGDPFPVDDRARFLPVVYDDGDALDLAPFTRRRYDDPEVGEWVQQFLPAGRDIFTLELLADMTQAIQQGFLYTRRPAK